MKYALQITCKAAENVLFSLWQFAAADCDVHFVLAPARAAHKEPPAFADVPQKNTEKALRQGPSGPP